MVKHEVMNPFAIIRAPWTPAKKSSAGAVNDVFIMIIIIHILSSIRYIIDGGLFSDYAYVIKINSYYIWVKF